MEAWAARYETRPDAKARELIADLEGGLPARRRALDERAGRRVHRVPRHPGLAQGTARPEASPGSGVGLLYGGMDTRRREQLRRRSRPPDRNPVRILLATDAASEGIDLHEHCHRLVNYDIPFNPNKLEQRIGRIDRYGQPQSPRSALRRRRLGDSRDSYEADLEFLARVAAKVARWRKTSAGQRRPRRGGAEADARRDRRLRHRARRARDAARPGDRPGGRRHRTSLTGGRLRRDLDATIEELQHHPGPRQAAGGHRAELDREQPLKPVVDERRGAEGLYKVPALTKSWARATEGLPEKLEREGEEPAARPSPSTRGGQGAPRHRAGPLGHPLVDLSARLLRAAVWSGQPACTGSLPWSATTRPGTHLVGCVRPVRAGRRGRHRLHEEVLYAGGWRAEDRTFRRLESLSVLAPILDRALTQGTPAAPVIRERLADQWARGPGLPADRDRAPHRRAHQSLQVKLAARQRTTPPGSPPASTRSPPPSAMPGRQRHRGGRPVQPGGRTRR